MNMVRFCPGEKCQHYSRATRYPRQCYHEPQCWKGYLDVILAVMRFRVSKGTETAEPVDVIQTGRRISLETSKARRS